MADGFRFERKNSPEIAEAEFRGGMEFCEEEKPRKTPSQKSSPNLPSHGDLSLLRTSSKDQPETLGHEVTTEDYDEGEIIASAEKEESPRKIALALAQPRQDETLTNFLGEVEHEAGRELIIVPPVSAALIPGSSSPKVSSVTKTPIDTSKEFQDPDQSPESISTSSRLESAKQDMKNLKSATLGRMGKMFKIRPSTPADREKLPSQTEQGVEDSDQQYGQDPTRKEKTHSLGRMLRLVDKDGAPRKLFSHTRAGSLTRLRKMHSTVGNVAGSSEESRNIFSRMINQFRGRNPTATNAEPNLQSTNEKSNSPRKPSLGTRLMMSLSARGNSPTGTAAGTTVDETSVERVAVEYTA